MKKVFSIVLCLLLCGSFVSVAQASYRGSSRAQPKPPPPAAKFNASNPMMKVVGEHQGGNVSIQDAKASKTRNLALVKVVDEQVGISRTRFVIMAEYKDKANGDRVMLRYEVQNKYGRQKVLNVSIQSVNGEAR